MSSCGSQRLILDTFLHHSPPYCFLRKGLSLNQELTYSVPGIWLFPLPPHWDSRHGPLHLTFSHEFLGIKLKISCLHVASTLLTELLPQPSFHFSIFVLPLPLFFWLLSPFSFSFLDLCLLMAIVMSLSLSFSLRDTSLWDRTKKQEIRTIRTFKLENTLKTTNIISNFPMVNLAQVTQHTDYAGPVYTYQIYVLCRK